MKISDEKLIRSAYIQKLMAARLCVCVCVCENWTCTYNSRNDSKKIIKIRQQSHINKHEMLEKPQHSSCQSGLYSGNLGKNSTRITWREGKWWQVVMTTDCEVREIERGRLHPSITHLQRSNCTSQSHCYHFQQECMMMSFLLLPWPLALHNNNKNTLEPIPLLILQFRLTVVHKSGGWHKTG